MDNTELKPTSKIVQMQHVSDTNQYQGCLMALCEDGSIWGLAAGDWGLVHEAWNQRNCEAQKKLKSMDEEYYRGFKHGMQLAASIIIVINLIYWNL